MLPLNGDCDAARRGQSSHPVGIVISRRGQLSRPQDYEFRVVIGAAIEFFKAFGRGEAGGLRFLDHPQRARHEPAAIALMQGSDWGVRLEPGLGSSNSWIWTCDLNHEYVTINGHYRT